MQKFYGEFDEFDKFSHNLTYKGVKSNFGMCFLII